MNNLYVRLAKTNLKNNKSLYVPYMVAGMITVLMFYIMMFINNSAGLEKMRGAYYITTIMSFGVIVVGVFSYIYIFYTNSFISKRRKKEMGIYNILGMEKRHIAKVLAIETVFTAFVSIVGGIVAGILFSKLALMLIYRILGIQVTIEFSVPPSAVKNTVLVFGILYMMTLFYNLMQMKLANPVELLRGSSVGEKEPKTKWLMAILGVVCLGAGYAIAITTEQPMKVISLFFVAVLLVIAGTYLLFTAGSIAVLKLLLKTHGFYYQKKHFIAVSTMMYRMKQNAAGLASICILSTMVLVMLSSTGSLMIGMEDMVQARHPNDFGIYMDTSDMEKNQEVLDKIKTHCEEYQIAEKDTTDYRYYTVTGCLQKDNVLFDQTKFDYFNDNGNLRIMMVMPLSGYCAMTGEKVELSGQEMLLGTGRNSYKYSNMKLMDQVYKVKGKVRHFEGNGQVNSNVLDSFTVVLADDTFDALYQQIEDAYRYDMKIHEYYGFNVSLDKDAQLKLKDYMWQAAQDQGADSIDIECRETSRNDFVGIYGGMFMLGMFLGTLFIMAMVLIIYYKQVSEGYEDRRQFEIMQKVGMSQQEVKKVIRSQILMVFFLPLVAAGVHMAVAFPMIGNLLKAFNMQNTELYRNCTIGVYLGFAVLYILIYSLTAKAYYRIVKRA